MNAVRCERRDPDEAGCKGGKRDLSEAPPGFDERKWRREYMRRYMRERRAKTRNEKRGDDNASKGPKG